jgi:hypothetical protein
VEAIGQNKLYPVCVRLLPSADTFFQVNEETDPCVFQYLYYAEPYLDFVTPPSGPNRGGSMVTLHTRGIPRLPNQNSLRCRFESYITTAEWVTNREIRCVTPS